MKTQDKCLTSKHYVLRDTVTEIIEEEKFTVDSNQESCPKIAQKNYPSI